MLWKEKIDTLAITISHNHTINDNDKKNFQWSYDDWNLTSMYNNLTHAVYLKSQKFVGKCENGIFLMRNRKGSSPFRSHVKCYIDH